MNSRADLDKPPPTTDVLYLNWPTYNNKVLLKVGEIIMKNGDTSLQSYVVPVEGTKRTILLHAVAKKLGLEAKPEELSLCSDCPFRLSFTTLFQSDLLTVTLLNTISVTLCEVSCLIFSQISDSELHHWKQLVAKCMTDYCSSECNKPDNKKLVWIVSKKTAQNLQTSHFSMPGLPTIPEGSWDESERFGFFYLFFCYFYNCVSTHRKRSGSNDM